MTDAVVQLASEVFATEADAWTWLNRPHPKLDEETPLQAAETSNGADRIKEILLAIKSDRAVE